MAKIFFDYNPRFSFQTKSLGKLFAFNLLVGTKKELNSRLKKPIDKVDPSEYVRTLISVCCHPESALNEEQHRPKEYSLSMDDVKELGLEELEEFASSYTNLIYHRIKIKGQKYGPEESESYIDYLHRVAVSDQNNMHEQAKRMARLYAKSSFSQKLQSDIHNTIAMGEHLMETINNSGYSSNYNPVSSGAMDVIRHQEERRWAPFKELSKKLDELIKISTETAGFITAMNKTQTDMAEETRVAGEKTTKISKINIFISLIIIGLTAFSIWIGYKSTIANNIAAQRQIELTNKYATEIIIYLKDINGNNKEVITHNENSFEKLIDQQTAILDELKALNTPQKDLPK